MYKVVCRASINRIFSTFYGRYKGLGYPKYCIDLMQQQIDGDLPLELQRYRTIYDNYDIADFKYAKQLVNLLESVSTSYRTRTDYGYLSIYLDNEKDLNMFLNDNLVEDYIAEIWRPDEEYLDELLSDDNVCILTEPMPYEYRVYLKPNKNPELANWLEANTDKTRVTAYALAKMKDSNWSNLYFYIRDKKLLLMVEMIANGNISRVERLVYKGNTDK